MLLSFLNEKIKFASRGQIIFQFFNRDQLQKVGLLLCLLVPISSVAQDINTQINGKVTDAVTGQALSSINVSFNGTQYHTRSGVDGTFVLSAPGSFIRVTFSYVGYESITRTIKAGQLNELQIQLHNSQNQLNEVSISSKNRQKYRNKGNPAVELIQQVIDHKQMNRMESTDYLQYDQYERIGLSAFNLPDGLLNMGYMKKFKFMLDTVSIINGKKQTSLPVYFNEKLSQNYFRKKPEKSIQVLKAEKGMNIIKFIDTAGLDVYLNRLYGDKIDIYTNNIFVVNNQFLSPIADHAPDFYKFFIVDTIQSGKDKLVELSFVPRNKNDLLFEGKLVVTLDGRYAVQSCQMNVNKQINVNFIHTLKINLDFQKYPSGHYYLTKSNVKADFGILRDKGMGVLGERTVSFSNYKLDSPQVASFYSGKSLQTAVNYGKQDSSYWVQHRTDTLTSEQNLLYTHVNKLQNMHSYKVLTWLAATFVGGFADVGPVQIGQIGSFFTFNNQEGARFQLGGRTTPKFNKSIYFEGFAAYGTKDQQAKYDVSSYYSFNKTPAYRFPNDYIKVRYLYDVGLPGETFAVSNAQNALTSFQTGKNSYWLYNRIFSVAYVKDMDNHFSYNVAFKNWNQQAAGTLAFQRNDAANSNVSSLTTSEIEFGFRYAPHEKIIQGSMYRHNIHTKYPILNLQINHAFKGLMNSEYSYTNISANISKRFYFSQLGYADVAVLGSVIQGKVPFPLLNISPANQSVAYDPNAYNKMDYLEFVSDHYAGLNFTQSFNGFFLNKIPLIKRLKWREYFSFKVLYGGLRDENNPLLSKDLYQFPKEGSDGNGTYSLGNKPYVESGVGVGNIFKLIRVDFIKRFNYLDHLGVSPYGVKLSFSPHL